MRHVLSLTAMVSAGILGTSFAALTEVSTGITASANGWDTRTAGFGCAPSGCVAENVLDDSIEAVSRWSCNAESSEIEACELTLVLGEPQDIMEMRMSLYKGDQRTRSINVWVDGNLVSTIESSGTTTGYETYELNELQATTIVLQAAGLEDNGWLSITGIQVMTDYDLEVSPPSPSPTGDGFVGCYNDLFGDRVLTSVVINEDLTPQTCAASCAEMGNSYYALQQGNECWCAGCSLTENETNTDYDRHGEGNCSTPCAGDSSSTCGDDMAFSLYQTASCVATPVPTPAPFSSTTSTYPSSYSSTETEFENIRDIPGAIVDAILADAVGGFAGSGFVEIDGIDQDDNNPFIIGAEEAGTLEVSGVFELFSGEALPASTTLFVYIDNDDAPEDFTFGQADLDTATGEFTFAIADFPSAYTRLILSFAVLDPADASEDENDGSVFPLSVVNNGCSSPLLFTLEWDTDGTDLDLWVHELGGHNVFHGNRRGDVGYLEDDNTIGFGPENYVVYGGLGDAVLGEYKAAVIAYDTSDDTAWTLTARSEGEVLWVEQGEFAASTSSTDDDNSSRRLFSFASDSVPFSSTDSSSRRSDTFTVVLDSYTDVQC